MTLRRAVLVSAIPLCLGCSVDFNHYLATPWDAGTSRVDAALDAAPTDAPVTPDIAPTRDANSSDAPVAMDAPVAPDIAPTRDANPPDTPVAMDAPAPRDVVAPPDVVTPRDVITAPDVPAMVCTPGSATCATATARRTCNADGRGYTTAECPAAAGATAACASGACQIVCASGRGDCDGSAANGCEAELATSASHCGMCGRACVGATRCASGTCAPLPPVPDLLRPWSSMGVAVDGAGRIVVVGGLWAGYSAVNTHDVWDPATNAWTARADFPESILHAAVVADGMGRIYCVGGRDGGGTASPRVWRYDWATDAWTPRAPLPDASWSIAVATGRDGKIYAFGGEQFRYTTRSAQVYDPAANTWTALASMPVARGFARAATANDGRIWVVGGRDQSGNLASTSVYDPAMNTWAMGPPLPGNRATPGVTRGPDGNIYVAGGEIMSGTTFATAVSLRMLNGAGTAWTLRADMPVPRAYHGFVTLRDGRLAAVGGSSGAGFLATVNTYDTATDTWR